jgi:hypothetical protein
MIEMTLFVQVEFGSQLCTHVLIDQRQLISSDRKNMVHIVCEVVLRRRLKILIWMQLVEIFIAKNLLQLDLRVVNIEVADLDVVATVEEHQEFIDTALQCYLLILKGLPVKLLQNEAIPSSL